MGGGKDCLPGMRVAHFTRGKNRACKNRRDKGSSRSPNHRASGAPDMQTRLSRRVFAYRFWVTGLAQMEPCARRIPRALRELFNMPIPASPRPRDLGKRCQLAAERAVAVAAGVGKNMFWPTCSNSDFVARMDSVDALSPPVKPPDPHHLDVHHRARSHQNGPRLPRPCQSVIIPVQRY